MKQKRKARTLDEQIADLQARRDRDETKARVIDAAQQIILAARKHDWTTCEEAIDVADGAVSRALGVKSKRDLAAPAKAAE